MYIFTASGESAWSETQKLVPAALVADDHFGGALCATSAYIIASADGNGNCFSIVLLTCERIDKYCLYPVPQMLTRD